MKKRLLSLFPRLQKSKFGRIPNKNSSSNWFFRCKMRFWARKSSEEKRKTPRKRWFLPQKWPNRAKKRCFGANMIGRGWSEKTDFSAVFATLWSSKMVTNEFFSHFFSWKSCRECRNALPLHSQSGSNALAREGCALIRDKAAKVLLWSLKVLHNRL